MSLRVIEVNGYPIMVFEWNGESFAYLAGCPHKRRPILANGYVLNDHYLTCPFHGAVFDLLTGELVKPPNSKTPCPSDCRLVKAILSNDLNSVKFLGDPFKPELPHK
ncbi:Rieske (2Fe-2S) protein [Caldivirga maquilingensis]|uniref:Rieske (2Fe-2S) domain protein n=1 Tax=Caldivirga maquilingensis (strain ATCC 700844 / DSM 13496 / JCM 10307 / IC-167) TaxID=397948 RepID=A8ME91_CALMQ|nr:Rieske 2Fe-2S domain-containing protein [Caldivirga maquilingensis]ABW02097.1 Rieske (2Fe-2S) domain protein [Caldivirga maquilingensis IC-167]